MNDENEARTVFARRAADKLGVLGKRAEDVIVDDLWRQWQGLTETGRQAFLDRVRKAYLNAKRSPSK